MKKTTLFIVALLCYTLSFAQTNPPDDDLENQVASATSQLNLSGCTSGIFIDQLPQYVPLEYFDGSYLSDSTTITAPRFNFMYDERTIFTLVK